MKSKKRHEKYRNSDKFFWSAAHRAINYKSARVKLNFTAKVTKPKDFTDLVLFFALYRFFLLPCASETQSFFKSDRGQTSKQDRQTENSWFALLIRRIRVSARSVLRKLSDPEVFSIPERYFEAHARLTASDIVICNQTSYQNVAQSLQGIVCLDAIHPKLLPETEPERAAPGPTHLFVPPQPGPKRPEGSREAGLQPRRQRGGEDCRLPVVLSEPPVAAQR